MGWGVRGSMMPSVGACMPEKRCWDANEETRLGIYTLILLPALGANNFERVGVFTQQFCA